MTEKKTHIGIPPFYMAASIYNTGQAHGCYFGDEGFIRPCFLKRRTKEERPKDTCQKAGKNLDIIPVSRRIADSGKWNFDVSKYLMHLASFKHPLSSRAVPWYEIPTITARFAPCAFVGFGMYCKGFGVDDGWRYN